MKEHVQTTGVRKWAGDDLIELQGEPLAALQALVEPYAPCIIQGCAVSVNEAEETYSVTSGFVALKDIADGENMARPVKIVRFAGAENEPGAIYLTLSRKEHTRLYADGQNKPIAYGYEAMIQREEPTEVPFLKIDSKGGARLVDTLGITQKLDRTGGDSSQTKVLFSDENEEELRSGNTLAKLFGGIKKRLDGIKNKLAGIDEGANNYTLPLAAASALGGIKIGYISSEKNYKVDVDGSGNAYVNVPWTDNNTTYDAATQSAAGLMSIADKKKLDGIGEGADKTTVDSSLSDISTNPVQNKVVTKALQKKCDVSYRGFELCISKSATDKVLHNGRGGKRTSSNPVVFMLANNSDGYKCIICIGNTQSDVTITATTVYAQNNIIANKYGFYVNIINGEGAWPFDYGIDFYQNGSSTVTKNYKGYINVGNFEDVANFDFSFLQSVLQATTTKDGLMSAADKSKLAGIAAGAQVNPTYAVYSGGISMPSDTNGYYIAESCVSGQYGGTAGTANTVARGDHKHSVYIAPATTTQNGLMSKDDKTKLDGLPKVIAAGTFTNNSTTATAFTFGSCTVTRNNTGTYSFSISESNCVILITPFSSAVVSHTVFKLSKGGASHIVKFFSAISGTSTTLVDADFYFMVLQK